MGFLEKLFGKKEPKPYVDTQGIFFYAQCNNCGAVVRLRIDKRHDLNHAGNGYVWHKTIVDIRCFRKMPTIVHFDRQHQITQAEIQGGEQITQARI